MNQERNEFPVVDPEHLNRIAAKICAEMRGTDDAPLMAVGKIAEYPPLYAAAIGIALARMTALTEGRDSSDRLARFLLAVAQDRVRSVFSIGDGPYWPDWMEDADG